MSRREVPRITNRKELVEALRTNPPDIMRGAEKVVDNSKSRVSNMFPPEVIHTRLAYMPVDGIDHHQQDDSSNHFGIQYDTRITEFKETVGDQTNLVGKRIDYQIVDPNITHPKETVGLCGRDKEGRLVELDVTTYKQGKEKVLVYVHKEEERTSDLIKGKDNEEVAKLLRQTDSEPKKIISIGAPDWDLKRAREVADVLLHAPVKQVDLFPADE